MGKGEIARYEQFLLFPQCFQKACFPGASKGVIVWEWVNCNIGVVFNCDIGVIFNCDIGVIFNCDIGVTFMDF